MTSLLAAHLQLTGLRFIAIDAEPVPAGAADAGARACAARHPAALRRGLRVD